MRALTYAPSYESIWKLARQDPGLWGNQPVTRHPFEPPPGFLGVKGPNGIDVFAGANNQWLGYALCKAAWANEERFKTKHHAGQWSLEEEHACVLNQLMSVYNAVGGKAEALPPLEAHIFDAANAHLLDGYILFEIVGRNCPIMLSTMNDDARRQVEGYIRKYVIVSAE